MNKITNDDCLTIIWGDAGYYGIVNIAKNYVSTYAFRSESKLQLEAKTIGIQVVPIEQLPHNYWSNLLSGRILGMGITLEEYLSVNNPELLL